MSSILQELQTVISDIVHEERDFQAHLKQMRLDQQMMDSAHTETTNNLEQSANACPHLAAHLAMFKVHRKMARDHTQTLVYCKHLEEKYKHGQASEQEMIEELRRLQSLLRRIQDEHRRLETERRKILSEHAEFVRTLSARN